DERRITRPSSLLRRYVSTLRRIERNPHEAPQTLAAVRNLEQMRRERLGELLAESRAQPRQVGAQTDAHQSCLISPGTGPNLHDQPIPSVGRADDPAGPTPRPITEVLRDVYEQDYEN